MDYEKLYKEALERAKTKLTNEVAVDIFHELAEDDRIRKELITFFQRFPYERIGNAGTNVNEVISWLEKQNELKPAEWSERDQMLLDCTISSVWAESNRSNGYIDNDTARDIEKWLESFKDRFVPQPKHGWKPSEEQMVVLNDIIINGHLSNANERILKVLQEQLKKLREE